MEKHSEHQMIKDLPGIAEMMEAARRRERIADDYEDFEQHCRTEAIRGRRSVMGEEIFEDSNGEGTRTMTWAMEEDVEKEVQERVNTRRLVDALTGDQ